MRHCLRLATCPFIDGTILSHLECRNLLRADAPEGNSVPAVARVGHLDRSGRKPSFAIVKIPRRSPI